MTSSQITVFIIVLLGLAFLIFRRKWSLIELVKIVNPSIALVQMGMECQPQLDSDTTIYSPFYSNVTTKTVNNNLELSHLIQESSFDLIHIFVDVDNDGNVIDPSQNEMPISTLINLMQAKDVKYIVFAKDNKAEGYITGAKEANQKANIVMTIERKGDNFTNFFKKIFSNVSKGQPFPVAWNKIAPQIPNEIHKDGPETFAVMGAGNIVLLTDK